MENNLEKKSNNWCIFFIKLDRLAAWVLLFVMLAYAITGYGMTKGLIDSQIAHTWHLSILGVIGIITFIIHTGWAIHLTMKRNKIWNNFTKNALISFYILLLMFFGYIHFFYQGTKVAPQRNTVSNETNIQTKNTETTTATAEDSTTKIFTAETLAKYNGLSGQPAYVAIDGKVYDVSSVYRNGNHHGYSAGLDLTEEFYKEHPANMMKGYEIVGIYQK